MIEIIPQIIINSVIAGAIYTLIAVGFNFIYGATRFFNLAHGVIPVVAAYVAYSCITYLYIPLWLSLCLGVLSAGVFGLASDYCVFKPLRAKNATNMVLLVASLGLFTVSQAIIALIFTSQFKTLAQTIQENNSWAIGSAIITYTQIWIVGLAIGATVALYFWLHRTTIGKAIRAVSDNLSVATMIGINTNRVIAVVFMVGSLLTGLAGVLIGLDTGLEPTMGMRLLLKGVIAAIIGGIGSISGALVGAFLLGFVENFGILFVSGEWKDAIAFGLLIIFLLFLPTGIMRKEL